MFCELTKCCEIILAQKNRAKIILRSTVNRAPDRTAMFPVGSNPRWRLAAILKISNSHILAMRYPIHFTHALPLYFPLGHYASLFTHVMGDWRLISQGTLASRPTI